MRFLSSSCLCVWGCIFSTDTEVTANTALAETMRTAGWARTENGFRDAEMESRFLVLGHFSGFFLCSLRHLGSRNAERVAHARIPRANPARLRMAYVLGFFVGVSREFSVRILCGNRVRADLQLFAEAVGSTSATARLRHIVMMTQNRQSSIWSVSIAWIVLPGEPYRSSWRNDRVLSIGAASVINGGAEHHASDTRYSTERNIEGLGAIRPVEAFSTKGGNRC